MIRPQLNRALVLFLVAAVLVSYGWGIAAWTTLPPLFGERQSDCYNLLADSFRNGRVYLGVKPDARLVSSPNPYDPAQRPPSAGLGDAAYYDGLYYVYFGAAPVIVLFLPWRIATGFDLPVPYAVLAFTAAGFFLSVRCWVSVRRRFFPDSGLLAPCCCIPVLGLVVMNHTALLHPDVAEVAIAAGYCFAMGALGCVAGAVGGKTPVEAMLGAGLLLGLAMASDPIYALAAPVLAAPLVGRPPAAGWRAVAWGASAFGAIVVAILWYNGARFDDAFDFGFQYQLTDKVEVGRLHFARAFVPVNFRAYFLAPAQWSRFFPFVHPILPTAVPAGYFGMDSAFGILPNFPFACLAAAAPLGLRRREPGGRAQLASILLATAILFAVVAGALLFFLSAMGRYMIDFTPALMLLAASGFLAIEREVTSKRSRGWALGLSAGLAAFSVFTATAAHFDLLFRQQEGEPAAYRFLSRWFEGPVRLGEKLAGFRYGPLEINLRFPEGKGGSREPLVATGWMESSDYLFVEYLPDNRRIRLGFDHSGYGVRWSAPFAVDFRSSHALRVEMGSLYPPLGYSFYAGRSEAETTSLARTLRVSLDGRILFERVQDFYEASPESVRIGDSTTGAYGGRFSGKIISVRRDEYRWLEPSHGIFGTVSLELVFPRNAAGRPFPLVTSGVPGRGNAVYVQVEKDGRARFGYDHWGVLGLESAPVDYDPAAVHRVEIRYGGLLPPARTGAGKAVRDALVVKLDGVTVWNRAAPFYPSSSQDIVVGHNLIGFSSCERDYGGIILSVGHADSEDEPLTLGVPSTGR